MANKKQNKLSAQNVQDQIFRKMPAGKKLKLASDFSMFLVKLNKAAAYGFSKTAGSNRKNT